MTTLAHLGGVPEALSVLIPLALVVVLLRMGARRLPPEDDRAGSGPAAPDQVAPGQAAPGPAAPGPVMPGQTTPGQAGSDPTDPPRPGDPGPR